MAPGNERSEGNGACSAVAKLLIISAFLAYISLGAYVFLVLETSSLPSAETNVQMSQVPEESLAAAREKATREVLDKLWDITENLNILYKENWTRLANEEILKLHDILTKDGDNPAPSCSGETQDHQQLQWSYSTAFLYALALITTLGSSPIIAQTAAGKIITILYATLGILFMLLYLNIVGSVTSKLIHKCFRWFKPRSETKLKSKHGSCPPDIFSQSDGSAVFMEKACETTFTTSMSSEDMTTAGPYVVKIPEKPRYSKGEDECNHRDSTSKSSLLPDNVGQTTDKRTACWPLFICFFVVLFYFFIGALCFSYLMSCSLLDGMLISFLLFTTAGIPQTTSNSVWQQQSVVAAVSVYVLCGLSLLSVCFNVLYEHLMTHSSVYSKHSHKRMK